LVARGLKTKIGLNIGILLLLSALVTDMLVATVLQGVMIRDTVSQSLRYVEIVGDLFFSDMTPPSAGFDPKQELATTLILSQDRIQAIFIANNQGEILYRQNVEGLPHSSMADAVHKAIRQEKAVTEEVGYVWSLFWWHPKAVTISVPIFREKTLQGAISAIIPMTPLYATLKKYHYPIFIYLLINTAVLTIVGLYRIIRHYLRPIDRIVQQADDFQEESDIFFAFRQEDNELNRLSSSLNRMLTRISSDKHKLQATVASLEKANLELKNTQREMISAEKLASVGRLAAGIAHEIGNPIGIVLGYLDMIKQGGLDEADQADFLKRTEDEVQRISTIIRQLLDLARPQERKNEAVNVNVVIGDIVDVMQSQPVMNDIRIVCRLDASYDSIWGNDDQLRQVFLNLLLNAADAIHAGKEIENRRITIRTSNEDSADETPSSLLQVWFTDSGDGIEPEMLQNIFDPFYTTKDPGKGTGLGLSVSYMIIESMGGTIKADSKPGQGATFRIELPLAEDGRE
jgi:two-component system, NtrC family, sensor kinase